jgi:hypothetical protein
MQKHEVGAGVEARRMENIRPNGIGGISESGLTHVNHVIIDGGKSFRQGNQAQQGDERKNGLFHEGRNLVEETMPQERTDGILIFIKAGELRPRRKR